jgi:hypothetical protein
MMMGGAIVPYGMGPFGGMNLMAGEAWLVLGPQEDIGPMCVWAWNNMRFDDKAVGFVRPILTQWSDNISSDSKSHH